MKFLTVFFALFTFFVKRFLLDCSFVQIVNLFKSQWQMIHRLTPKINPLSFCCVLFTWISFFWFVYWNNRMDYWTNDSNNRRIHNSAFEYGTKVDRLAILIGSQLNLIPFMFWFNTICFTCNQLCCGMCPRIRSKKKRRKHTKFVNRKTIQRWKC